MDDVRSCVLSVRQPPPWFLLFAIGELRDSVLRGGEEADKGQQEDVVAGLGSRRRHVKRCAHHNQQGKVERWRLMSANKDEQKSLACINVHHHPWGKDTEDSERQK